MPTVAVEVAYSDSYAKLQRDGRLWLEGTDNAVNVVLLINLRLLNNRTRLGCNVEVWRRGVPPIRMVSALHCIVIGISLMQSDNNLMADRGARRFDVSGNHHPYSG